MALPEIIVGVLLVLVLLGLAAYFFLKQGKALEGLKNEGDWGPEDRLFVRKQVQRRLLCSVLMVCLAGMLVGWFFLERELTPLSRGPEGAENIAPDQALDKQKQGLQNITLYWGAALLLLLGILFLATFDMLATVRFGFRHKQQLDAQRQAMLETQARRWRQEREKKP